MDITFSKLAERCGYQTHESARGFVLASGVITGLVLVEIGMLQMKLVEYGYFSPFVAVAAILSAKFCVRVGLAAALLSIVTWDYFIAPPVLQWVWPGWSDLMAFASAIVGALATAPRLQPPLGPPRRSQGTPLPFTRGRDTRDGNGLDASFWDVVPAGTWHEDDWCGRQYGSIYLAELQNPVRRGCPPLAWIVRDMVRNQRFGGIEAGFLNRIEVAAARPEMDLQEVREIALFADDDAEHRRVH